MILRILAAAIAMMLAHPLSAASIDDIAIASSVKGGGPTIVFVHGYTCDSSVWAGQVDYFARNHRVVTLDLPGHGASDEAAVERFSMDFFAAAVEAVREEIGAEKVVFVGHSMGALVIRQYALRHPERVAGLVAVDGVLDAREIASYPEIEVTPQSRAGMVEYFFSDATTPAMKNDIRNMMLNTSATTAKGAMNAMLDPSIRSEAVVDAPTLSVMAGNAREKDAESIRQVFPEYRAVRVEGTGHFLMMEKPEAFNALLAAFLQERAEF